MPSDPPPSAGLFSAGRLLGISVLAYTVLLLAACRHNFVWGSARVAGVPLHVLFNVGEGIALVVFALVGGGAYAALVRRAETFDVRWIWRGALLLTLLAWLAPPFLSSDVFDYLARGRVEAAYGGNPYTIPAGALPPDPVLSAGEWGRHANPYGPLWTVVQTGAAWLVGLHVWLGVYLLRLVTALAHLLTGAVIAKSLTEVRPDRVRTGLMLWLWNPWLLLESANSGHNDALMAAVLAVALLALVWRWFATAALAFVAALLVKHGCVLIGPLMVALAWRQRRVLALVGGGLLAALLFAPLLWHYFADPAAWAALRGPSGEPRTSLQAALLWIGPWPGDVIGGIGALATVAFVAVRMPAVADVAGLARAGAQVTVVGLLLALPAFAPWYHLWWLPLLALWGSSWWPRVFVALAFTGPLSYAVFAATRTWGVEQQVWQWLLALAVPAALIWPWRTSHGVPQVCTTRG